MTFSVCPCGDPIGIRVERRLEMRNSFNFHSIRNVTPSIRNEMFLGPCKAPLEDKHRGHLGLRSLPRSPE